MTKSEPNIHDAPGNHLELASGGGVLLGGSAARPSSRQRPASHRSALKQLPANVLVDVAGHAPNASQRGDAR